MEGSSDKKSFTTSKTKDQACLTPNLLEDNDNNNSLSCEFSDILDSLKCINLEESQAYPINSTTNQHKLKKEKVKKNTLLSVSNTPYTAYTDTHKNIVQTNKQTFKDYQFPNFPTNSPSIYQFGLAPQMYTMAPYSMNFYQYYQPQSSCNYFISSPLQRFNNGYDLQLTSLPVFPTTNHPNNAIISKNSVGLSQQKAKDVKKESSIEDFINDKKLFLKKMNSKKGSIKLQKLLDNEQNPQIIKKLFTAIQPSIPRLTNHMFGNYFIQTLLCKLNQNSRQELWKIYNEHNLEKYIMNDYGVHIIIKLIQATAFLPFDIQKTLETDIEKYVYSPMGSYLYQILYENLISNNSVGKYEFEILVFKNSLNLSQNINSVVLLKKVISCLKDEKQKAKAFILKNFIFPNLPELLKYKFGCQAIDTLITHWEFDLIEKYISKIILDDLIFYSINKYSSQLIHNILVNRVDAKVSIYIMYICIL